MTLNCEGHPSSRRPQIPDRAGAQVPVRPSFPVSAAGWSPRGSGPALRSAPRFLRRSRSCPGARRSARWLRRRRGDRGCPEGYGAASTWLSFGPAACGGTKTGLTAAGAAGVPAGRASGPGRPPASLLGPRGPGARVRGAAARRAARGRPSRATGSQQLSGLLTPRGPQGSPRLLSSQFTLVVFLGSYWGCRLLIWCDFVSFMSSDISFGRHRTTTLGYSFCFLFSIWLTTTYLLPLNLIRFPQLRLREVRVHIGCTQEEFSGRKISMPFIWGGKMGTPLFKLSNKLLNGEYSHYHLSGRKNISVFFFNLFHKNEGKPAHNLPLSAFATRTF